MRGRLLALLLWLTYVVLLGGALVALAMLIRGVDGGAIGVWETARQCDKFSLANLHWDPTGAQVALWVILVGGIAQNISCYTADQAVVQRYMTTASERLAARSIWTNALLSLAATFLFFGIGTALFAFYRSHPERLDPTMAADQNFPLFIAREMPVGPLSSRSVPGRIMDIARKQQLLAIYRDGLLADTLPFWIPRCVDRQYGGFLTALDHDGTVVDTDKGVWQQGRFTWLLGELYNHVEPRPEWLELARHGADFLDRHCFDPADGRMWFHVTRDGRPIRKRRYAFSESFASIAYGELAKATGQSRYADKARATFDRFLQHHLHPPAGTAKYTATRPMRGISFPMITIVTAQELRESIGLEAADEWIDRSIETIVALHLKPDIECVMETVGMQGEIIDHFDGRLLNPGHAIECAWFIMREGMHRNDSWLIQTGCRMLDWMWQRGWDSQYGGILYFTDVDDRPLQEYWHEMKFWWPHNETIMATLLAHHLTGERKYADWHEQVHGWAYRHFPDPQHGEWFGYLDRSGRKTSTLKGGLWKGPFHLPRMQLLCTQLLSATLG